MPQPTNEDLKESLPPQAATKSPNRLASVLSEVAGQGPAPDEEAVQLAIQAMQLLMQAAQVNPNLEPIVQQMLQTLKGGLQQMTGEAAPPQGGMGGPPGGGGSMMGGSGGGGMGMGM